MNKQNTKKTISVNKEEYEALVQAVQVTKEYLAGKSQFFNTPQDLIQNFKEL